MPVTSCGMKLDDKAVRVTIGLWLGLELCVPHQYHCGAQVDAHGCHAFVCKKAAGQINSAPCSKRASSSCCHGSSNSQHEGTAGLCRSDWKRSDGFTLVLWQSGKSLVCDVTVDCSLADSYVASVVREARCVAELVAAKKEDKYSGLAADYLFQPIVVETLGPVNELACDFFHFWWRKLVIIPAMSKRQLFCFSTFPC